MVDELWVEMCEFKESVRDVVAWVHDSQAGPRRRTPMAEIQCFCCRKNGHFARDCMESSPSNGQHSGGGNVSGGATERTSN